MDLRQLEVFAGVYELRSFSRTASALRLTQSTVSEHVRLLEEELGTRLFDRLSRETVPTRAGELLYGYAKQMLSLRSEARQALDQFLGQVTGTLLVGASTIPGEYVLPADHRTLPRTAPARVHHAADLGFASDRPGRSGWAGRCGRRGRRPERPWARGEAADAGRADRRRSRRACLGGPSRGHAGRAPDRAPDRPRAGLGVAADAGATPWRRPGAVSSTCSVVAEMGSTSAIKQAVKAGVGVSVMSSRAVEDECRLKLLACVKLQDLRSRATSTW